MNNADLEIKSSAFTLSDMEIFVFPELLFSLVLANLMSPRIWRWRADPWFDGLEKLTPYRRIVRLKQYIIDHYAFNLDLETWGLTTKQRELERFAGLVDADLLRQSNALFGYEGDKYYFDIDIRAHFGLDKLSGDVIPYWKTETVEAMDAFRHKENYQGGAGECVSLAALYAAALFIIARVPLKDIYLMATPLHSQNFVDLGDGILTNNRRLVTKAMWFNGTALSAQARRALENERVTILAHEDGYLHTMYPEYTVPERVYQRFAERLASFLRAELTAEMLGNYLRHRRDIQKCFQIRFPIHGQDHYINAERAFAYEAGSACKLTDATRPRLLAEIELENYARAPWPGVIVLNDLEDYLRARRIDWARPEDIAELKKRFDCRCLNAEAALDGLIRFCRTIPRLPELTHRKYRPAAPLGITLEMSRTEIIAQLEQMRSMNRTADLAFHAYRDLNRVEAEPFLHAALRRSPVSIAGSSALPEAALLEYIAAMPDQSIYDEPGRLSQPDEVWNYRRGDGVEKAVLLANILLARAPQQPLSIEVAPDGARLLAPSGNVVFKSGKQLRRQTWRLTQGNAN